MVEIEQAIELLPLFDSAALVGGFGARELCCRFPGAGVRRRQIMGDIENLEPVIAGILASREGDKSLR